MTKNNTVKSKLNLEIIDFMKTLGKWDENLTDELPTSWENYNGFIVFSYPSFKSQIWFESGTNIWLIICKNLKAHSVAIKDRIINDSFRSPQARLVYGNSSIVNYTDNKIKYSWNVKKTMFSAGNVTERHRIASLQCDDQVIVDLFAGIGYFTLPYLVHAKAKFVHACEWNPDAIDALRRNLQLNKVEYKCLIYEGDNRKLCPKNVADRVNIGLIPSSEDFWKIACGALRSSGGILYVHENVTSRITSSNDCEICEELVKKSKIDIQDKMVIPKILITKKQNFELDLNENSSITWKYSDWFVFSLHLSHIVLDNLEEIYHTKWNVSVDEVFKVKSYAPHIDHLVLTVLCKP